MVLTQHLLVNDIPIPAKTLHEYTVRWFLGNGGPVPVLYHSGKRITAKWDLILNVAMQADPQGENANTA